MPGLAQNQGVPDAAPTIHALQFDVAWEDAAANCARVESLLAARPPAAGALVVLPEMFSSGFSMAPPRAAQPPGGATEAFLARLALKHRIQLVAGVAVADVSGGFGNEAVVFDPSGHTVARYRKQRPFSLAGEHVHYPAGSAPAHFAWAGIGVAPFICYDLRFPELFRVAARRWKPELFVVMASWPEARILHWVRLLQARAIENQAYVIGVNRIGRDPSHRHVGRSVIVDFNGELLADAGATEGSIEAPLDLPRLHEYRTTLPFLADLRPLTL